MDAQPAFSIPLDFQFLAKNQKLSWLSETKFLQMTREYPPRFFKRGEVISKTLSLGNFGVRILLSGRANIICHFGQNRGKIVAVIAPGIVPSIPVLNPPIQNHYEYRAATNCRVLNIPRRRFFEIGLGINLPNNGLFDSVLDSLSSDLGNLLVRYGYFLALDLVGRVAFTLLELAEKFGIRDTRRVILPHFFSHDDLADLVGASRSRVTSAVSILERQHIIGREGRQIVVDIVALKAFIASRTSKRPDPLLLEAAVPK